jgi:type II secretory pathway component PulL
VAFGHLSRDGSLRVTDAGPRAHRVLVIPGEDVLSLRLDVPGRTPAQRVAGARRLLEPHAASPVTGLAVAVEDAPPNTLSDAPVWVCAIDPARLEAAWAAATAAGFEPHQIVPDHLLLVVPGAEGASVAEAEGTRAVRTSSRAFTVETALAEQLGVSAPAGAAISPEVLPALDLGSARAVRPARSASGGRGLWLAAATAGVLIASLPWSEAYVLTRQTEAVRARAGAVAGELLDQPRVANPLGQTQAYAAPLLTADRQFARALTLLRAVGAAPGVVAEGLAWDREGALSLRVVVQDRAALEPVLAAFAAAPEPLEVREVAASPGTSRFELLLGAAP